MNVEEIVFCDPPEKVSSGGRASKLKAFVAALEERPGEWALWSSGLKQVNAHTSASLNRKKFPHMEWVGRREDDGLYGLYARVVEQ